MNFKNINIGNLIHQKVTESNIEISRICKFIKCTEEEISTMYESESLDTEILLRWSKLLEYDFFRIYSQHLILFSHLKSTQKEKRITGLPVFRKSMYTKDLIDFILEQVSTGEMSKKEIIEKYKIPKTTLYKWISKYENSKN